MSDDQDWGWRVDLKSYIRWLLYDEVYDFLRTRVGRTSVAELIAAGVVIYAYAKNHPDLLLLGLGAVGAFSLVLISSLAQRWLGPRAGASGAPTSASKKVELEYIEIVNQTIERRDVPLDGYKYLGCTFTDVTFVYNNGDAGGFDHTCRMGGKLGFKSEDPHIQTMLGFLAAIRLLRPDLQEKYTPKLGAPNPLSDATLIATADELGSFWSRLVSNWNDCKQKFANFDGAHEYVQNFWDELNKNKADPQMRRVERMFPGQTLNIDDIVPMQKQMVADAVEFRNTLVDFVSLLSFSFK